MRRYSQATAQGKLDPVLVETGQKQLKFLYKNRHLAHHRWWLHHRAAILTCSKFLRTVELFEHALKLSGDVLQLEILLVELLVALLTEPEQTVQLAGLTLSLDHKPDGVCATHRVVWNAWR